ncbi:MAG: 3-keto-disaccharide hydrolase [Mongoliitalea sp.]
MNMKWNNIGSALLVSGLLMACAAEKEADLEEIEEDVVVLENALTEDEKEAGWMLLFDGEDPFGWRAFNGTEFPEGWTVEDGALKALGLGGDIGGDIVFGPVDFDEFELEFTWKIAPGGNSGVFYHVVEGSQYKAPYETGPEYQVIDQLGFPEKLEDWQSLAADYGMYAPDLEGVVKEAGEWNTSKIIYSKNGASYWLNGKQTVSFVPRSEDWTARRNSGKWDAFPDYAIATKGLISLQDHGSEAWFKNIKIRQL